MCVSIVSLHCNIFKVDKEKTLLEQEICHGSTVDLIIPLFGGTFGTTRQVP